VERWEVDPESVDRYRNGKSGSYDLEELQVLTFCPDLKPIGNANVTGTENSCTKTAVTNHRCYAAPRKAAPL
jgi:hypothetical protein